MNEVFRFDSFSLDVMARTLRKEGHEVSIGSRAFDILAALVEGEGKVLTRRELMACAWPGLVVEESNVRVQVAHLRKALGCGEDGVRFIVSVAGRGYCFAARVRRERVPQPVPSRRLAPSATARVESGEGRPLANAAVAWERIIGREESVAELTALLSQRRLVTIVGAAGMGKTTVAVQAARSLSRVGNPVHFADLSLVTRGDQVLDALSSAAGYRPSGSVTPTGLAEFLDAHSTLVVLDNCEHVIADAALLCRQILDTTRQVSILCTSREALRVLEELVYLLPSLASPPNTGKLTAEQAVAWPSVQLFVNRAEECGALDVLSDESASMLAAICRRLDGNPLAIELVASRVGTYGVQGVSELLATQAGLHWQGRRDATPRHRTVEALLDWTYDLLPEGHRLALCRLSVFSGGFALESAVDVISDDRLDTVQAATAIADLADKSLICARSMDGRMRLRLLETTRAYAAEKLAALDGHDTAHRHALYYADYLRSRDAASTPDPGAPPDVREDELGNVRVALDWAFSNAHDAVLAVELSALAAPSFLQHRSFDECMRCCVRALARMPVELQSTHTELVLREAMAIAYASMGLYGDDMVFVLQRGLEISQSLADHRATFHLYAGLHLTMLGLGRFQESMRVAQQYAGLASSTGKASEAVIASWMIGASHHFIGEHSTAEAQFATARRMLAHASLRRLQYFYIKARLNASLGMARTKLSMGLPEQALQLSINTIEESRGYPDSLFPCATLFFPILLWNNREQMAEALLEELGDLSPEYRMGSRPCTIEMLNGLLLQHREHFAQAEAQLRRCLPGVRIIAARLLGLQAMAEVLRMNGKPDEALVFVEEAIVLADTSAGGYGLPDLLRAKGEIMMDLPRFSAASVREHFAEAMRIARQSQALGWEIGIALALARLEMSQRRATEAKAVLQEVYSRFTEGLQARPLQQARRMLDAV